MSLKGKIIILSSLAVSQLIYPLSLLGAPEQVTREAMSMFYEFLWSGKPDKVRCDVVIQTIEEGGLKMNDVDTL